MSRPSTLLMLQLEQRDGRLLVYCESKLTDKVLRHSIVQVDGGIGDAITESLRAAGNVLAALEDTRAHMLREAWDELQLQLDLGTPSDRPRA